MTVDSLDTLVGHSAGVSKLAFSPDGNLLASCSADTTGRVWNIRDKGSHNNSLAGHKHGVSDICWHPSQQYLATASDDTTLGIWDVETSTRLRTLEAHTHFVFCCKFHQHGSVLVSGAIDEAVRFWDIRTGHCIKAIPAHSDPVTALDFSWDGTLLASVSSDGLCRLWDFSTGLLLRTLLDKHSPSVTNVQFSPNAHYVLESVMDPTAALLRIWDWRADTGRVVRRLTGHVNSVYCLPSRFVYGTCAMSATEDGHVAMWNVNSQRMVQHDFNTVTPDMEAEPVDQPNDEAHATEGESATPLKPKVTNPRAINAMDVHEELGLIATSQVGNADHVISLAKLPPRVEE